VFSLDHTAPALVPVKKPPKQAEHQEEVKMNKSVFLGALTVAGVAAGAAAAGTLDDVKARGKLNCGVTTGLVGFAAPNANGEWEGFDVAVCRAVAAATLGDSTAVEFVPTTGKTRFTALASGEIDMLARNTTWTFSRDVDLKFEFTGVNYYDGQGFMVPKDLGVTSANLAEMSAGTNNPEINRLLGTEGTLGEMLGLSADWAKNAIASGGNYGEVFAKNIGEDTPIGLARGLNAQWTEGGLLYSPPFR
jgi:hypothetical protein